MANGKGGLLMGILAWILLGLLAGALAQLLLPGDDPGGPGPAGVLITIVIGIAGASAGGLVGAVLGFGGVTELELRSLLVAILGALLLLLAWRALRGGLHANA